MRKRLAVLGLVAAVAAVAVLAVSSAQAANSSEQVIFSKTGAFSPSLGPFGFWVWCEADSQNPYAGACNGSMYFYLFGTPRHVSGFITEGASGIYTMHVSSADGFIRCTLTNTAQAVSGPKNTVHVDCTSAPPISGSADASGAVVNVTGP
jgi:hypothetical protein